MKFLGVDGGGSKTLAVIVDGSGRELSRALGASSNQACVGMARAAARIFETVREAAQRARCSLPLDGACIGLAGIDRRDDRDAMVGLLAGLAAETTLGNDAELILTALDRGVGMAVIVGTGSIAIGRDAAGHMVRAGGWGHVMGDEGSGYDLGNRVLRHAARAADRRGPPTRLLDLVMQHFGLQSPAEMVRYVYPADDKASIARLARLVFQAADEGDAIALEMMHRGANELSLMVATAARALDFPSGIPLALAGSVALYVPEYRRLMLEKLAERTKIERVVLVDCPALSAAHAARRTWEEKQRRTLACGH